jgi:hypothetical protein
MTLSFTSVFRKAVSTNKGQNRMSPFSKNESDTNLIYATSEVLTAMTMIIQLNCLVGCDAV